MLILVTSGTVYQKRLRIVKNYQQVCQRGRLLMQKECVVFCGIARDVAQNLNQTLAMIERVGALFKSYKVILYENDSTDGTDVILQQWQRKLGKNVVTLIQEKLNRSAAISSGGFSAQRFETLAYCRNKYLKQLHLPEYDDSTYVIVLDMDLWDLPIEGLMHSFGIEHHWSSISANGVYDGQTYYDSLAFRSEEFPDTLNSEAQRRHAQRVYNTDHDLVRVKSAFGGLTIYKRQCMNNCFYTGNDCEHVGLHDCQRKKDGCSQQYMNPAMILRYHF